MEQCRAAGAGKLVVLKYYKIQIGGAKVLQSRGRRAQKHRDWPDMTAQWRAGTRVLAFTGTKGLAWSILVQKYLLYWY